MVDDLDELLGPKPAGDDAAVREAVLRRTTRVVRLRSVARRVRLLTAAALLFGTGGLAGALSMLLTARPVTEYVVLPVGVVLPPADPSPPPPAEYVTAEQIELEAEQAADRATAATLYRQAGDRFLADRNDSPQAARCYRLFLMRAGPDALSVSADDSWLLIALKQDQREANRDEGL